MSGRVRLFILFFLCLFAESGRSLFADFKLSDPIKEFGEKRYLESVPTRFHAGPLKFHPKLTQSAAYDSNILLENEDPHDGLVFNIQPGAIVELPIQKHQIVAGYDADIEFFTKDKLARQNDQNQKFFVLTDFSFPSFYVNVLERFAETSGRAGTTFTERIPRFDQAIHPKMGYRWKRIVAEAGFRHFVRDFRRQVNDSLDFQLVEWTGVLYYDLFARLKALVEYQVAQIDYDDDFERNGTFQQSRIGLEGEIQPNLFAKLRLGPHFRNYEESSQPNFYSWVGYASLEYQMRQNLKLELGVSREPVEATFADVNFYREHALFGAIRYRILPTWLLFTESKYANHRYAERATLNARSGYRHDNRIQVKSGLRYEPRDWLGFETGYEFVHRDSNFNVFDYRDHLVYVQSDFVY